MLRSRAKDGEDVKMERRVQLGKEWRDHLSDHKRLAECERYIRIRGKDFRAVSLSPDNPCGRLLRENGSKIQGSRNIRKAIEDASCSAPAYSPGNNKPEHKVQAFLIREALQNDLRFGRLFEGFGQKFDDILFVTDEFRLDNGKLRADLIAIGRIDAQYFPVLIELKAHRELTRLIDQLNGAKDLLEKDDRVRGCFDSLLCAVSGVDRIDRHREMVRLIIWPGSESGRESRSVREARERGILMARYSCHPDGGYRFALDDR